MLKVSDKKSAFGALARYANPALIPFESCMLERSLLKHMSKKFVDTNIILRYLLHDVESQQKEVDELIAGRVSTIPEVLPEVVYVLRKFYKVDRQKTAEALLTVLEEIDVAHKAVMIYASKLYGETKLDFVDCLLIAYHRLENVEIITFDEDLNKLLKREEQQLEN